MALSKECLTVQAGELSNIATSHDNKNICKFITEAN